MKKIAPFILRILGKHMAAFYLVLMQSPHWKFGNLILGKFKLDIVFLRVYPSLNLGRTRDF